MKPIVERLQSSAGIENVLVVAVENITSLETWLKLCNFYGFNYIDRNQVPIIEGSTFNSNEMPGIDNSIILQNSSNRKYKYSDMKPMLSKTRRLIDQIFFRECIWLKQYGIFYPSC